MANTWYNSHGRYGAASVRGRARIPGQLHVGACDGYGQVEGANGTFYGGDTPTDPNNIRFDNGPSDIDIRNRFTHLRLPADLQGSNSGEPTSRTAGNSPERDCIRRRAGLPRVSGTIYSGNTAPRAYADESGIFGGAMSSSSGSATSGRPPANWTQQHSHAGLQRLRHSGDAQSQNPREYLGAVQRGSIQPAQPQNHYRREQHLHNFLAPGSEASRLRPGRLTPAQRLSSIWLRADRVLCALPASTGALGLRHDVEHQQQHSFGSRHLQVSAKLFF